MASGFVPAASDATGDEWIRAQRDIEERRREKAKEGQQEGGKTLYEVLQANKLAKQEAFEESIKLKNQFRTLDDGEADFLDSVLEGERAREATVRRETVEGLEAFRKQRESAESIKLDQPSTRKQLTEDEWAIRRKRKRDRGHESEGGVKARRLSSPKDPSQPARGGSNDENGAHTLTHPPPPPSPGAVKSEQRHGMNGGARRSPADASPACSAAVSLGLAAYSSDEED